MDQLRAYESQVDDDIEPTQKQSSDEETSEPTQKLSSDDETVKTPSGVGLPIVHCL